MWKKLNSDANLLIHANAANSYCSAGFTLLELLLSAAIISALAGLSLPIYRTLIKKNDLDIAANTMASSLRRAQVLSQAVDGDTTWGVKAQSGSIVIFKGASYSEERDTNFMCQQVLV